MERSTHRPRRECQYYWQRNVVSQLLSPVAVLDGQARFVSAGQPRFPL